MQSSNTYVAYVHSHPNYNSCYYNTQLAFEADGGEKRHKHRNTEKMRVQQERSDKEERLKNWVLREAEGELEKEKEEDAT